MELGESEPVPYSTKVNWVRVPRPREGERVLHISNNSTDLQATVYTSKALALFRVGSTIINT